MNSIPATPMSLAARNASQRRFRAGSISSMIVNFARGSSAPGPAGDENGARRADAGGLEGGVLTRLADFEVESAAAVDDAPPVPLEPSEHRGGQFGGVAVVAGMRGGAHPIVVDTLRRRLRQIED